MSTEFRTKTKYMKCNVCSTPCSMQVAHDYLAAGFCCSKCGNIQTYKRSELE
jgi:transcription initiation factor IIE alpha subunit